MSGQDAVPSVWLTGTVVRGGGRGRGLGFPTANIAIPPAVRPAPGIYACWGKMSSDSIIRPAVLHVGPRPVFQDNTVTVELHFLNLPDADLYDQEVSFACVARMRSVENFDTIEGLIKQMRDDCAQASDILKSTPHHP